MTGRTCRLRLTITTSPGDVSRLHTWLRDQGAGVQVRRPLRDLVMTYVLAQLQSNADYDGLGLVIQVDGRDESERSVKPPSRKTTADSIAKEL